MTRAPVVVAVARGGSDIAVRAGAADAVRTGRPLHLVHVAPQTAGWEAQLGRDSLLVAEHTARLVGPELEVVGQILHGSVLPSLVEVAAGSALVVLERRKSSDLRWVGTSTSDSVAAAIDVPALVVPAGWLGDRHGVVSVGLDPQAVDEQALAMAIRHARLRTAVLRALVADDGPAPTATERTSSSALRDEVAALLDRLGGDACDLAIEVEHGAAGPVLVAATSTSDLLVLGRHRPALVEGSRLGPVARSVLDGARCPVLLTEPTHVHADGAQFTITRKEPA